MENDSADTAGCLVSWCVHAADPNCPIGLCTDCWWWAADTLTEHHRATHPRSERRGTLYIAKIGDRIKIGFTTQPKQRFKQYPPGAVVLAFRDNVLPVDEKELHNRFTQFRVAGREWYRDAGEIRAYVAELVAEHGKPPFWMQPKWGSGQSRAPQYRGRRGRPASVVNSKPWLT